MCGALRDTAPKLAWPRINGAALALGTVGSRARRRGRGVGAARPGVQGSAVFVPTVAPFQRNLTADRGLPFFQKLARA